MSYVHFWILIFKQTYFISLKLIGSEKERKLENKKDMKKKKKKSLKASGPPLLIHAEAVSSRVNIEFSPEANLFRNY